MTGDFPARRAPSIRSRLVLLVAVCIVPAALLVTALVAYDHQRDRAQLLLDSTATARALMSAIDRDLAGIQAMLLALSKSPYLAQGDLARFHDHALEVLRTQRVSNIVLIDDTLRQRVNTLIPLGEPLPPEPNESIRSVFEIGKPVVSDLFIGPVARRAVIAVAVPATRGERVEYVVAAGLVPDRIGEILAGQHLPADWIGAVIDRAGVLVARTHEPQRFVGQPVSASLRAGLKAAAEGAFDSRTVDDIEVHSAFSTSAVSGWTVAIGIPRASLAAPLRRSLLILVTVAASLFALSALLAWAIGGRIARSLHDLIEPALMLGRGEAIVVPHGHLRETREIAQALSTASAMLLDAQHRAGHDVLTGLGSRALFKEVLRQQIESCSRTGSHLCVALIDLDGFKAVNDLHGHAAGDEVLRTVARRIKDSIRLSDFAARLGGDEFALVLMHTNAEPARGFCERLAQSLSDPYEIGPARAAIGASIGLALFPEHGRTGQALVECADAAMYAAKRSGGRRCTLAAAEPAGSPA